MMTVAAVLSLSGCAMKSSKPPSPADIAADEAVETVAVYEWATFDDQEMTEEQAGKMLDQAIVDKPGDWRLHALRASHFQRVGDSRAAAEHERARELVVEAEPEYAGGFPQSPTQRTWFPGYDEEPLDVPIGHDPYTVADAGSGSYGGRNFLVDWEMSTAVAQGRSFDADYARCLEYAAQVPSPGSAALTTAIVAGALGAGLGAALGAPFGAAGVGAQVGAASWGIQGGLAGGAAQAGRRDSIIVNCLRNRGWALL